MTMRRSKNSFGSFGSFGSLRSKFVELFSETKYEDSWVEMDTDFQQIEKLRLSRKDKLTTLTTLAADLSTSIGRYKQNLVELQSRINTDSDLPRHIQVELRDTFSERWKQVKEIEKCLPQKHSLILQFAVGNINVTLPKMVDRMRYKADYENFKLKMTILGLIWSALLIFLGRKSRIFEAFFQAVICWYYSTISLREHILIANGSRIKRWWLIHHYLSIFLAAILLTWPGGEAYDMFFPTFHYLALYIEMVQLLQFKYQTQRLYRLRALGKADMMDITAEGIQLKGSLTLLVPFLLIGQMWQLYVSYVLYNYIQEGYTDWQIPYTSVVYFVLAVGNIYSTIASVIHKIRRQKWKDDCKRNI